MTNRLPFVLFIFLLFSINGSSQTLINKYEHSPFGDPTPEFEWTESIIDHQNNIITVGHTLIDPQNVAVLLTKKASDGTPIWETTFAPTGALASRNYGIRVITDAANNIYVAGTSIADAVTALNYLILKLDSNGNLQWSQSYNGADNLNDVPSAIALNNAGELFVTGGSYGASSQLDYATVKINPSNGTILWEERYNYADLDDAAVDLSFDNSDNPIVLGASEASSVLWDYTTLKYNKSTGSLLGESRVQALGGLMEAPAAFVKDSNDNYYISGSYSTATEGVNIQTLKLDANFNLLWSVTYDRFGQDEAPYSLRVDGNGNLYMTGFAQNQAGYKDLILQKLDSNGTVLWTRFRQAEKAGYHASGLKSSFDLAGNIYCAGQVETMAGAYLLIVKYNESGDKIWETRHQPNSTEHHTPSGIFTQNAGTILIPATKEESGSLKYYSLELEEFERGTEYAFVDTIPIYKKHQLIVKFDPSLIKQNAVNNLNIRFARPDYFLKTEAIDELNRYVDIQRVTLVRIFTQLTTEDTVSISRLAEEVPIPAFWSSFVMLVPPEEELGALIRDFEHIYPTVIYSHLNYIGQTMNTDPPNDHYYNNGNPDDGLPQYALDDLYDNATYGDANINMMEGWCIETGKAHIRVGVIDDGLDYLHQDLGYIFGSNDIFSSKIIDGWYFAGGGQNLFTVSNVYTFDDHGMAMAGIMGALTNNRDVVSHPVRSRIAGVAGGWYTDETEDDRGTSLYSLGILEKVTYGGVPAGHFINADLEYISNAIVTASMDDPDMDFGYGLHVMNNSWGIDVFLNDLPTDHPDYGTFTEQNIALLRDATHFANRNHVIFTAARGNGDPTVSDNGALPGDLLSELPLYPACYHDDWVINVGGTGWNGKYKDLTNGDDYWEPSIGLNIDVAAPSASSTIITLDVGDSPTGGYKRADGTSSACAFTSGLASLLLSHANTTNLNDNENLAPEDVEFILQETADYQPVPDFSQDTDDGLYNRYTGYGKINAGTALEFIQQPCKTVWHFDTELDPATINTPQLIESDRPLFFPEPPIQIPDATIPFPQAGEDYLVDIYEVTATISHNLPTDDILLEVWPRASSTTLYGFYTADDEVYPYEGLELISFDDNTATLKGYIYHFKDDLGNNQGWLPYNITNTDKIKLAYSLLTTSCTTNTEDNINEDINVTLYPNPSRSTVYIDVSRLDRSDEIVIECFDAVGRVVETVTHSDEPLIQHDVTALASGLYFYRIRSKNVILSKPFVKE